MTVEINCDQFMHFLALFSIFSFLNNCQVISAYTLELYCINVGHFHQSVSQAGTLESLKKYSVHFIILSIGSFQGRKKKISFYS